MRAATRSLSLVGLRTFCTVARCGTFRSAAEELFVTASAVSHRIRSLEEELGCILVERGDRSISLTDTGQAFFEEVAPLLDQIDESAQRVMHHGERAYLHISAQPFFASELLVPALDEFTFRHPDVDITVDTSENLTEKHPAGVDISLRLCRRPPERYNHDKLFALRYIPAGSSDFRDRYFAAGQSESAPFPVIIHARRPNAWSDWLRDYSGTLPEPSTIIQLDSMISIARAAERGLGAALIPLPVSQRWFDEGVLFPLFEQELATQDSYYLISSGELSPAANAFRGWVLQKFGSTH